MIERPVCHLVGVTGECAQRAAEAAAGSGVEILYHDDIEELLSSDDLQRTGCVVAALEAGAGGSLSLVRRLQEQRSPATVVFLASGVEVRGIVEAIRAGAHDVLACPGDLAQLGEAIESACAASLGRRRQLSDKAAAEERLVKLTPGECDVLEQMLAGKVNKSIAVRLGVALRTVEARRKRVFTKMGTRGLTEIAAMLNAAGALQEVRQVHEQLARIGGRCAAPQPALERTIRSPVSRPAFTATENRARNLLRA